MSRPRQTNKQLPVNVYFRHGAYYHVIDGKWHHLGRTLTAAMTAYAIRLGQPDAQQSIGSLLDRVIADATRRVAPSTLHQYQIAADKLRLIFREFTIAEVRPADIAQVMDHHAGTPNMANRLRTVLKMAFDLAVRAGLIDYNPVVSIAPHAVGKRTRYLTDTEYQTIWTAANPATRAIMDLAYLTGQRISDVLSIREQQITAAGIEIDQGKTGKRLLIAWTPDLRAAVTAARQVHDNRKLYLLGQRNGRLRSYTGVRDCWDRACALAGVTDAHLHDLRAKAITDAKRQGLDPKHLAGHSTESVTNRYLRGLDRDVVQGPSFERPEPQAVSEA